LKTGRIFGPKREEVAGGWRRPHNDVIKVIQSRIRWTGYVARMEGLRNELKIVLETLERKRCSEDLDVDGRIILEGILEKNSRRLWTGFIQISIETSGGLRLLFL
jgi:hypothetical protein